MHSYLHTASVTIALRATTFNAEEGVPTIEVCAEVVGGTIDDGDGDVRTATLATATGTASAGKITNITAIMAMKIETFSYKFLYVALQQNITCIYASTLPSSNIITSPMHRNF